MRQLFRYGGALSLSILYSWGASAACPSNLDDSLTTPDFGYFVQFDDDDNTSNDWVPFSIAQNVANALDATGAPAGPNDPPGAHERFANLGFATPFFNSSPPDVCVFDSTNLGGANFCQISMDAPSINSAIEADVRLITDHELFHHIQYAHINNGDTGCGGCSGTWGQWTCEGTARAMQDLTWDDIDANAGTMATYLGEINQYLGNPNNTLTNAEYKASLWWVWLAQTLGSSNTEPGRGVDVIDELWEQAEAIVGTGNAMLALENTIDQYTSESLESLFQDFTIANYAKDYDASSLPNGDRYFYIDETVAGQNDGATPLQYAAVATTTATLSNTLQSSSVNPWAARYLEVDLSDPERCDLIGFRGEADDDSDVFGWTVIGIDASDNIVELHRSQANSVYKAFLCDADDPQRIVRLAAVVTGLSDGGSFDYAFASESLASKNLEIVRPTITRPEYVGEGDDPERFLARVNVTGPAVLTPDGSGTVSVKGLSADLFNVYLRSGGTRKPADIINGAYVGGEYWLSVQAPELDPADPQPFYDLEVCICLQDETEECIVTEVNNDSVVYSKRLINQVLVVDNSGSMGSGPSTTKLEAAQAAASLFVDSADDDDYLGVASFSGDGVEPNFDAIDEWFIDMVSGNRVNAQLAIGGISLDSLTSIGDGLIAGQNQLDASPLVGPDVLDYIVLLSDGMENEAACWSNATPSCSVGPTVKSTVFSAGGSGEDTIVDTIAFGPTADQAIMQDIASSTNGDYYYVDLSEEVGTAAASLVGDSAFALAAASVPSGELLLQNRLAQVYTSAAEKIYRKQRLFSATGFADSSGDAFEAMELTENKVDEAVLAISWSGSFPGAGVTVLDPFGNPVTAADAQINTSANGSHTVYRFYNPIDAGDWEIQVGGLAAGTQYLMTLSGKPVTDTQTQLWFSQVPAADAGIVDGARFLRGMPITLLATLGDSGGPIANANVVATVALGKERFTLGMFDDGNHDDGEADDGVYGAIFTRTETACSNGGVPDNSKDPGTVCSYVVDVELEGVNNREEKFSRSIQRSFQVFEYDEKQDVQIDTDNDRLPNRWEVYYGTNPNTPDADEDYDNDRLSNLDEFLRGTDPWDNDTDKGGVMDGWEVNLGDDPLDPRDDNIPAPKELEVIRGFGDEEPDVGLVPGANLLRLPCHPLYQEIAIFRGTNANNLSELTRVSLCPQGSNYVDDTAPLDVPVLYAVAGVGASGEMTRLSPLARGVAKEDPVPPRGFVLVAEQFGQRQVVRGPEVELLLDNGEGDELMVKVSNLPDLSDASWQPNPGNMKWVLAPGQFTSIPLMNANATGNHAMVYAQFMDAAGNESSVYHASVLVDSDGDLDDDGVSDADDNCPIYANGDQADSDGDGIGDVCDNCQLVANNGQIDSDGDGFGNVCDADLSNNNNVGNEDIGAFLNAFGSQSGDANYSPQADFNSNGSIGNDDIGTMVQSFGQPPGPSGLQPQD